jgi:hypothetical protein
MLAEVRFVHQKGSIYIPAALLLDFIRSGFRMSVFLPAAEVPF